MTAIYLYSGAANPNDIILRDPTVLVVPVVPDQGRVIEVTWPGWRRNRKKNEPDYGLVQDLIRQRDEAIAAYHAEHEAAPEPEVVVSPPPEMSGEGIRKLRELLEPLDIRVAPVAASAVDVLAIARFRQQIEDDELAIVLSLAV